MTVSKFERIGRDTGKLVADKQAAYGDSFGRSGRVLKELYPEGIMPGDYDNVLTVVRMLDKIFRIATDKDALGENPFKDICGYALLAMGRDEDEKVVDAIVESRQPDKFSMASQWGLTGAPCREEAEEAASLIEDFYINTVTKYNVNFYPPSNDAHESPEEIAEECFHEVWRYMGNFEDLSARNSRSRDYLLARLEVHFGLKHGTI